MKPLEREDDPRDHILQGGDAFTRCMRCGQHYKELSDECPAATDDTHYEGPTEDAPAEVH